MLSKVKFNQIVKCTALLHRGLMIAVLLKLMKFTKLSSNKENLTNSLKFKLKFQRLDYLIVVISIFLQTSSNRKKITFSDY